MKVATPLHEILENDWDAQLFRGPKSIAHALGWSSYHTLRSKGSRSGYPDRTCVRERILFAELKREKTKPTPDQVEWLDRLARAGGECYLWRPSDLEEIGHILASRWIFHRDSQSLQRMANIVWYPGSMWIPGAGRRDAILARESNRA